MSDLSPVVARVITWLPVGGIERRFVAVVPRLRDRGWDMRVFLIREEGALAPQLRDAGIPVQVLPIHGRLSPIGIYRLTRAFRRAGVEVVHSHMYRSNIPSTLAGHFAGARVILGQIHNVDSWDTPRQALTERTIVRWRSRTLCVSKAVQRDVAATLRIPESSTELLYNGIDCEAFRPDHAAGQALRTAWGIGEEEVLFVVPARLHPQKNPIGTAEAFLDAAADRPARLVFVGGGKLEAELLEFIKARSAADKITLAGQRDDMAAVYNAADAVVLSSLKEGFSNAVVEAMACGKPVIASDVGGNREAVDRAAVGWIHPAEDGRALASQLTDAIGRGRSGLAIMALDCRRRAQDFSIDALVENTHQLYGRLLGRFPL